MSKQWRSYLLLLVSDQGLVPLFAPTPETVPTHKEGGGGDEISHFFQERKARVAFGSIAPSVFWLRHCDSYTWLFENVVHNCLWCFGQYYGHCCFHVCIIKQNMYWIHHSLPRWFIYSTPLQGGKFLHWNFNTAKGFSFQHSIYCSFVFNSRKLLSANNYLKYTQFFSGIELSPRRIFPFASHMWPL